MECGTVSFSHQAARGQKSDEGVETTSIQLGVVQGFNFFSGEIWRVLSHMMWLEQFTDLSMAVKFLSDFNSARAPRVSADS